VRFITKLNLALLLEHPVHPFGSHVFSGLQREVWYFRLWTGRGDNIFGLLNCRVLNCKKWFSEQAKENESEFIVLAVMVLL
jgi:hypothetical protein